MLTVTGPSSLQRRLARSNYLARPCDAGRNRREPDTIAATGAPSSSQLCEQQYTFLPSLVCSETLPLRVRKPVLDRVPILPHPHLHDRTRA